MKLLTFFAFNTSGKFLLDKLRGTFPFKPPVSGRNFKTMENQTPSTPNEALQQKLERLQLMHVAMQPSLRGRWIRLAIRETLTVALYIIFWKHEWVRLSLYVVAPLVLLNLGMLSALTWGLPRKIEKLKAKLEERKVA